MNFPLLLDDEKGKDDTELKNIMIHFDYDHVPEVRILKEVVEILKEGRIKELSDRIHDVLNCHPEKLSSSEVSLAEWFLIAQMIIRFLLHLNFERQLRIAKFNNAFNPCNESNLDSSLKMKLFPETACLDTQEKYWRGRLKKVCEDHERLKNELLIKNSLLEKKLETALNKSAKKSIAIQTENSLFSNASFRSTENIAFNLTSPLLERPNVFRSKVSFPNNDEKTFTAVKSNSVQDLSRNETFNHKLIHAKAQSKYPFWLFPENILDPLEKLNKSDCKSSYFDTYNLSPAERKFVGKPSDGEDILEEVDTFLRRYDETVLKGGECHTTTNYSESGELGNKKVRQTITKLFTNEPSSIDLTDKLIKIYEKQRMVVSDECEDEDISRKECKRGEKYLNKVSGSTHDKTHVSDNDNPAIETGVSIEKEPVNETTNGGKPVHDTSASFKNGKYKILPFFRIISSKIMKRNTKFQHNCVNAAKTGPLQIVPLDHSENIDSNSKFNDDGDEKKLNISEDQIKEMVQENGLFTDGDVGCDTSKLCSRSSRCKSTDHMDKKVGFADDMPSHKNPSKCDIRKVSLVQEMVNRSHSLESVGTAQIHFDRFNKPVPAPRSRKNILLARKVSSEHF